MQRNSKISHGKNWMTLATGLIEMKLNAII